jgi:hypothetical protein
VDACDVVLDDGSVCGFRPEPGARPNALGLHRWSAHGIRKDGTRKSDGAPPPAPALEAGEPGPFTPPPRDPESGEIPPARGGPDRSAGGSPPARRGLLSRFKRKSTEGTAVATKERAPKNRASGGRRLPAGETLGDVGGLISGGLAQLGHVPTSRMVAFQAPAAGELADELLRGTPIDRIILQPVVRSRGALDKLFALLAPATFTWRMEKAMAAGDEAAFQQAEAGLKWSIKEALPTLIPAMKKVREREAKQAAALVDLLEMSDLEALGIYKNEAGQPVSLDTGQVVDIGDIFAATLFAEWVPPAPAPPPSPEEAPQNA